MSEELKPCPFCKAEPLSENNRRFFLKHKLDCFLAHPMHNANCDLVSTGSIADHIEAWNTRPTEDALKARNKELVETVKGLEKTISRAEKVLGERNLFAAEVERLKNDFAIQKNLTNQACFESNRAYDEVEKWKKMFYDLLDKQASVSTDPKVIVVESHSAESEGKDE